MCLVEGVLERAWNRHHGLMKNHIANDACAWLDAPALFVSPKYCQLWTSVERLGVSVRSETQWVVPCVCWCRETEEGGTQTIPEDVLLNASIAAMSTRVEASWIKLQERSLNLDRRTYDVCGNVTDVQKRSLDLPGTPGIVFQFWTVFASSCLKELWWVNCIIKRETTNQPL